MRSTLRFVLVLTAAALLGFAANPPAIRAADTPRLIEQRPIEIPDSRIIAISPDGTAIAAADWDLKRLCIYEVETLAQRTCADLAPLKARLRLEDVVWSPDSSKLALAEESFKLLRDGDLWLMDAVTGQLTNLTDDGVNAGIPLGDRKVDFDELFFDVSPTWLPDGSGITFSRTTWRTGEWAGNQIVTVPVTGGETELLTIVTLDTPGVVYYGMRWTADASQLFYSVNYPDVGNPDNGIWRVNADGLGAEKLVGADPELGPPVLGGVSPDGKTVLAYYAYAADNVGPFRQNLYALFDVATGTLTPLTIQVPDAPEHTSIWPATLSPDGAFVLYASRFTNPEFQVFMTPVNGGEETNLVPEGLSGATVITLTARLTWANDGTLLMGGSDPSSATLLTIEGGTDLAPVAIATPVAPIEDQATPPLASSPADLQAGATVTVNDNDVPMRAAPSTGAQTVATLALGTELTVVGPPVEGDGFTWVPVTDPATGTIGYVRIEFITAGAA